MELLLPGRLISVFSIILIASSSAPCSIHAQQPYVGKATSNCDGNSNSVLGYTFNGLNATCQAYLTFRSQPPYTTVASISELLGADPSLLSQLNSVSQNASFRTDQLVLVPTRCSRSGTYYQANTSYVVKSADIYLSIANYVFRGLSACQAIQAQNPNLTAKNLHPGDRLLIPLRCACPTKNQTDAGFNYLLSYVIAPAEFVSLISSNFGVDTGKTLEANQLSEQDSTIYPNTTLLVPLRKAPSISQIRVPPPPPPASPPPPTTTPPSNGGSSSKTWVYALVGALGGGAFVLLAGIILFCLFFRKSAQKNKQKKDPSISSERFEAAEKPHEKIVEEQSKDFLESISDIAQSLKVYSFQELQSATQNFSPSCWIRGSVYHGTINGDSAAIKKMDGDVSKEIDLLNKTSHFNLIRLSGVCFNEGHWYLVYEFAVNGPLSDWIYHRNSDHKFLNWTQRIQIALDVATGLNYIHNYTSQPYVHKDIKSGNVLLDGDFRAKIANFGLARSAGGQEGEFALTRHIVGTQGYMAPEYLEHGFVSTKMDVYSFGVLMLEILTGKDVKELYERFSIMSDILIPVLNEKKGKQSLVDFMDPSLQGNYPAELAIFVARLVDSCIKKDPSGRPGMDEIVQSLTQIMTTSQNWASNGFWTKKTLVGLGLGQFLSLLITSTGFSSSELARRGVNAPTSQSFLNYVLLALVYGGTLLYRKKALKAKWYYYILLGLVDVEANFLVVKAYQYTSLTSVMLLDCWSIPSVIFLTWMFLKTKYRYKKFIGVAICVAGLVAVVFSDVHSKDRSGGSNPIKGDLLVIAGATLYAVSNVSEEFFVKSADRVELMAMLGIFGAIISACQISILERNELKSINWSAGAALPFIGFALAMFLFYSGVPILLKISGSTMLNLSLLTSDMWTVLIRIFAYHEKVDWIYFIAFATVAVGLVIYSGVDREEDQNQAEVADEEAERSKHFDEEAEGGSRTGDCSSTTDKEEAAGTLTSGKDILEKKHDYS